MAFFNHILEFDARLSMQVRLDEKDDYLHHIFSFLAHSADSWILLPAIGLFWLFSHGEWKFRLAVLGIGIFAQAILVLLLKFMIRRRRPAGEWGAIYRNTDPHSFPSGHAARVALMAAIFIALGPVWLAWVTTIWAILVCLARVMMGVHYFSDIFGGIIVGPLVAWGLIKAIPLISQWFPFLFR